MLVTTLAIGPCGVTVLVSFDKIFSTQQLITIVLYPFIWLFSVRVHSAGPRRVSPYIVDPPQRAPRGEVFLCPPNLVLMRNGPIDIHAVIRLLIRVDARVDYFRLMARHFLEGRLEVLTVN